MRRLSLLFATLFCAAVAQAAGDREVRGRILDMQGRPVPEAVITVRGMGRHAVSDTAGVYRFPHLKAHAPSPPQPLAMGNSRKP